MAGQTTQTDGGGNFQFLDVSAGIQMLGVDAAPIGPSFPMYGMDVTLVAGQTTQLPPFRIAPPPPLERFEPLQNTSQDQVITDPRFPGASFVATVSYDAANQQLAFGNATMAYDDNGNLTSLTDPAGSTTFTPDARNRLIGVSGPNITASFEYDALGRRATKIVNEARTKFLYDGLNPVQESTGAAVFVDTLGGLGRTSTSPVRTPTGRIPR